MAGTVDTQFKFQASNKKYLSFNSPEVKKDLTRWDLHNRCSLTTFTYNNFYKEYQAKDFVRDFFNDSTVQANLQVFSSNQQQLVSWGSHEIKEVQVETVPCTVTNMSFFDRLTTQGLVRDTGHIYKCLDEDLEGFLIADEVHRMLLTDESEHWDLYSEEEKGEFLHLIFKHLVLGGPVCQYDDMIERYLEVTKALYKELITVQKDTDTQSIKVASQIIKVSAWDDEICWYPGDDHLQTWCYLILNPVNRIVTVFSHDFGKGMWS